MGTFNTWRRYNDTDCDCLLTSLTYPSLLKSICEGGLAVGNRSSYEQRTLESDWRSSNEAMKPFPSLTARNGQMAWWWLVRIANADLIQESIVPVVFYVLFVPGVHEESETRVCSKIEGVSLMIVVSGIWYLPFRLSFASFVDRSAKDVCSSHEEVPQVL